jgi:hypothetical protein
MVIDFSKIITVHRKNGIVTIKSSTVHSKFDKKSESNKFNFFQPAKILNTDCYSASLPFLSPSRFDLFVSIRGGYFLDLCTSYMTLLGSPLVHCESIYYVMAISNNCYYFQLSMRGKMGYVFSL